MVQYKKMFVIIFDYLSVMEYVCMIMYMSI